MGATNFETRAPGKTASEAFDNAVQDAIYWHGHEGYSGTIKEKSGFTVFSLPLNDLPVREYEQERYTTKGREVVTMKMSTETRLLNAISWYTTGLYEWNGNKTVKVDPFAKVTTTTAPHWVKAEDAEAWVARNEEMNKGWSDDARWFVDKMGRSKWEQMCEVYDDKWGNAVAIKVGDDEWLFCGMASC